MTGNDMIGERRGGSIGWFGARLDWTRCAVSLFCSIMVFSFFGTYADTPEDEDKDEDEVGMLGWASGKSGISWVGLGKPRASGFTLCTIITLPVLHHCSAVDGIRLLDLGRKATGPGWLHWHCRGRG
jgi:hypothetical protein